MWLAPPPSTVEAPQTDAERVAAERWVFTELDHSYVNPVTARMLDLVEPGFAEPGRWAREGSSASPRLSPRL